MNARILITDVHCPLCGSGQLECLLADLIDVEDRVEGVYAISRCTACDLTFLSRRPTPESLPACYTTLYHVQDPSRSGMLPALLYGLRMGYRRRRLAAATPGGYRALLEIGCGDGGFLRYLGRTLPSSVKLVGIDLQATNESQGRLRLIQGEVEKVSFAESFDVIVLFNVLEHLADPVASLRRIVLNLSPGGMVCGEVPNWGSPWRRLFPRHWQGLQIPRHMTAFEKNTLEKTLQAAGLEVVAIRGVYDPGDLAVTVCNWITDSLRLRTPPRRAWFYLPTVLLSAPIVWLANLLTRTSGCIEFIARRSG